MPDLKGPDQKTLLHMRRWVWIFLILGIVSSVAYGLSGLKARYNPDTPYEVAQKKSRDPMKAIRHIVINGQNLWVPIPYFTARIPSVPNQEDVSLTVLYPDFFPLKETPQRLWEKGEWSKKVRILVSDTRRRKNIREFYQSMSKSYGATVFQREEYGLKHYSQPDDAKSYGNDFWVEGNIQDPTLFIMCGKKLSEITVPQCSLHMEGAGLNYWISFNRDLLLLHWKEIRDKSLDLVESFRVNPSLIKQPEGE